MNRKWSIIRFVGDKEQFYVGIQFATVGGGIHVGCNPSLKPTKKKKKKAFTSV